MHETAIGEIQANRALRRRPAKRVCCGKRLEAAARLLTVLGNGRRLLTVMHLMEGERTVTGLRSRVGVSRSSVSQHLAILVEHGIVESRTKGEPGDIIPADRRTPRLSSRSLMF
ncbi:ArsR/SmtB family transcription factor [Mesorhizobium opportunistum]